MRRTILFALTITLPLLLCGCGGKEAEAKFQDWQAELRTAESFSFAVQVSADSGESVLRYDAEVRREAEDTRVELTAPELLAGVVLHASDGGAVLEYNGACLELGELPGTATSPAAILPLTAETLRGGRLLSVASTFGDGESRLICELACEPGVLAVWLSGEPLRPGHAELSVDGRTVAVLEFNEWSMGYRGED